ncbi:MAG TPA: isoprenylcysteine carboxylmethyltransferase family protein [Bryobacteraceae bacterium]|nr:isoprenylcysteine carboxylmethyltransferase family protein [Bryobacteraceae bacterium]
MSWVALMLRFAIMVAVFGAVLFGSAGRLDIPAFWVYLLLFALTVPLMYRAAGSELMRERIKPPPGGKDQLIRIVAVPMMLAHLAIAGLDVGRFHWSDTVPVWLQVASFAALAVCVGVWGLAMHENKFFSSVIRIQRERGHRVVDTGPYRIVRHPGYAGALTIQMWSGLALGSVWSLAPAVVMAFLFIRRILLEDRMLLDQLDGYKDYAQRVRYRVLPGVW